MKIYNKRCYVIINLKIIFIITKYSLHSINDITITKVRMSNSFKIKKVIYKFFFFFNYILFRSRSDPNIRVIAIKFPLKRPNKGKGFGKK